jgi:hypothetical protein
VNGLILISLVVALIGAAFQRNASSSAKRHRIVAGWTVILSMSCFIFSCNTLAMRGYSTITLFFVSVSILLVGLSIVLTNHVDTSVGKLPGGPTFVLKIGTARQGSRRLQNTQMAFIASTACFILLPLRHAGALEKIAPLDHFARAVSFGKASPISSEEPIRVHQCLLKREVNPVNRAVVCGHPHEGQVLARVKSPNLCPKPDTYSDAGRIFEVVPTRLDGVIFCIAFAVSESRLTEFLEPNSLAKTM